MRENKRFGRKGFIDPIIIGIVIVSVIGSAVLTYFLFPRDVTKIVPVGSQTQGTFMVERVTVDVYANRGYNQNVDNYCRTEIIEKLGEEHFGIDKWSIEYCEISSVYFFDDTYGNRVGNFVCDCTIKNDLR